MFLTIIHKSQILFAHFYVCLLIYEKSTVLIFFTLTKGGEQLPPLPPATTGLILHALFIFPGFLF